MLRLIAAFILTFFTVTAFATCDDDANGRESVIEKALVEYGETAVDIREHLRESRELFPRYLRDLQHSSYRVQDWLRWGDKLTAFQTLTGILDSSDPLKNQMAKHFIEDTLLFSEPEAAAKYLGKFLRLFPVWSHLFTKPEMFKLLKPYGSSLVVSQPSVLGPAMPRIFAFFEGDWKYVGPLLEAMPRAEYLTLLATIPLGQLAPEYLALFEREKIRTDSVLTTPNVKIRLGAGPTHGCCTLAENYFYLAFNAATSFKALIYIRMGGVIVGAIKNNGSENSFLGMNTVRDAEGRLVILRGGLYSPAQELADAAIEFSNTTPDRHRRRYPLIFDSENIELRPLRMIGHSDVLPENSNSRTRWMRRIAEQLDSMEQDLAEAN